MGEQLSPMLTCPFCGGEVEIGCVMGPHAELFWYQGKPSFWRALVPHGEFVGKTGSSPWPHMPGVRCQKCRKIVLDY